MHYDNIEEKYHGHGDADLGVVRGSFRPISQVLEEMLIRGSRAHIGYVETSRGHQVGEELQCSCSAGSTSQALNNTQSIIIIAAGNQSPPPPPSNNSKKGKKHENKKKKTTKKNRKKDVKINREMIRKREKSKREPMIFALSIWMYLLFVLQNVGRVKQNKQCLFSNFLFALHSFRAISLELR